MSTLAAGPVSLDGTLRAVVAADRLALSEAGEEQDLVRRRLPPRSPGTRLYMPPETILHSASVGPAADVHAFGCLAWFLLAGRPPFPGKTIVEVCLAHVQTNPEPPSRHAPNPIPADLDALILRCLDKDAQQRPTMRELGEQLGAAGCQNVARDDAGTSPAW